MLSVPLELERERGGWFLLPPVPPEFTATGPREEEETGSPFSPRALEENPVPVSARAAAGPICCTPYGFPYMGNPGSLSGGPR